MKKNFCDIVKEKVKNSHYHKYEGIAPEGFKLIPRETLERLRDFDTWKEWKNNPQIMEEWMIEDSKKL